MRTKAESDDPIKDAPSAAGVEMNGGEAEFQRAEDRVEQWLLARGIPEALAIAAASPEQRLRVMERQMKLMRAALEDARSALESLPADCLGVGEEPGPAPRYPGHHGGDDLRTWPLRAELIDKINRALEAAAATPREEEFGCADCAEHTGVTVLHSGTCPKCGKRIRRDDEIDHPGFQ